MLESTTRHLEATTIEDVPPLSWERITFAAEVMAARLFPEGTVALRAVSDSEIRELNRAYREVDSATDILSFPSADTVHIGDLALSWETTQRQAAINGNTPEQEALALIAHGLLHLAGYDHDTDDAESQMHSATLDILSHAGVRVETFGH
jgi:probable rRNA maturation factor